NRSVCVANDAVAIDDENAAPRKSQRTERAVQPRYGLVGVGEQRKLQALLAGKHLVALDALRGDAEHLRIERFELVELAAVRVQLLRAHRGVVARIEDEDDSFVGEVRQRNRRATRRG